jgi:acyl dehydratase
MQKGSITYEDLSPGYEFPPITCELNASFVSDYVRAVESSKTEFVPPLAVTACGLTALTKFITLPPDTIAIHASQELQFFKAVPIGTVVECRARVARKLDRSKMSMLLLELDIYDQNKEKVQSGKTTLALPGQNA